MPAGNTLIGEAPDVLYASDSPERAQPMGGGGVSMIVPPDANRIANMVAFIVLFALVVLILIRIAGLQGMIAVGRST